MGDKWIDEGCFSPGGYRYTQEMLGDERHGVDRIYDREGTVIRIRYYIHDKQVSKEEYREYKLVCQLAGIEDE